MSEQRSPLRYLNSWERRLLGPLVRMLMSTSNPRLQRAIETTGEQATVRMACVNALRTYAIVLFVLGAIAKFAQVSPLADVLLALATASMVWSFWCLYTVVGPERDFKRRRSA